MTAYDKFDTDRAKIDNDPNLSDTGRRTKMRELLTADLHEVVRVQKLAERRKNLQPPAIDKADAAGAMLRARACDRLEKMGKGERKVFLANTSDPLYLAAVLEAPGEFTGVVDAETREMVLARAVEFAHPGALAALEKSSAEVTMLDVAARVLTEHAAEHAGLPNVRDLDELINTAIPDQRHLEFAAEQLIASAIAA